MDFKWFRRKKANGGWLGYDRTSLTDVGTVPVRMRCNVKTLGRKNKQVLCLFCVRYERLPMPRDPEAGLLLPGRSHWPKAQYTLHDPT